MCKGQERSASYVPEGLGQGGLGQGGRVVGDVGLDFFSFLIF